ncbi:histidine kinase [Bacillaceae bacterium S4-13-56]
MKLNWKNSIQTKLLVLLLIIIILPMGTSIILTYYQLKSSIEERAIKENMNMLSQGKMYIEDYLNGINQLSVSIYTDSNLLNTIKADKMQESYVLTNEVMQFIQTLLYSREGIEQIFLYAHKHKLAFSLSNTTEFNARRLNFSNWGYFEQLEYNNEIFIKPPHMMNDYGLADLDILSSESVFSLHRPLYNLPLKDFIGYLIIDINMEEISKRVKNLYISGSEDLFLISPDQTIVYSSEINHNTSSENNWMYTINNMKSNSDFFEWEDTEDSYYIFYERLPESLGGWVLVKKVPHSFMFQSINEILRTNISIGIFALALVIFSAILVSFQITKPIKILAKNMDHIGIGDLTVDYDSLGKGEIGQLGENFKRMVVLLNNYIEQVYEWELKNKNNQLRILQTQINPHFLYNTLQSIGTLALQNNMKTIYRLLNTLANIMRYSINYQEDYVVLEKEFLHAKWYLELQKQRFGEKFEYQLTLDDTLKQVRVPKMILQPLIENYFKHGFTNDYGKINISAREYDTKILLEVSDNGDQITNEVINKISSIIKSANENLLTNGKDTDTGIGLYNVVSRLRIFYDNNFIITPILNEEKGLTIRIIIFSPNKGEDTNEGFNSR